MTQIPYLGINPKESEPEMPVFPWSWLSGYLFTTEGCGRVGVGGSTVGSTLPEAVLQATPPDRVRDDPMA